MLSHIPTSFSALQGRERLAIGDPSKKTAIQLGSFFVEWDELGHGGLTTNWYRQLARLTIHMQNLETFDEIRNAGADEEFTLILRTGNPVDFPYPTSAQLLAGQLPVRPNADGRFLLRFKRRHAIYTIATQMITFHRDHLQGGMVQVLAGHPLTDHFGLLGAPQNHIGRPFLLWEHDLFARGAGGGKLVTVGWCGDRGINQMQGASIDPDDDSRTIAFGDMDVVGGASVEDPLQVRRKARPVMQPVHDGPHGNRKVQLEVDESAVE